MAAYKRSREFTLSATTGHSRECFVAWRSACIRAARRRITPFDRQWRARLPREAAFALSFIASFNPFTEAFAVRLQTARLYFIRRSIGDIRMTRDHRRLAAIVSADVVGHSLPMGRDDSAPLAGLKTHRRELIDPKIAEYGGRIVKTTGDGLLLEFPSVVDAVRCAVDIQRGMAERNADVAPDHRIAFRIGINVGDIIIDGDDIFGDGVNVAARLQTLAEPGGICVSRVVRDQVLDKLSFGFDDLGPQEVKNIARPVEVYRVDLGSEALQKPSGGRRRWQRLTRVLGWRWFAAAVVAFILVGAAVWYVFVRQTTAASAGPPFMSVAVMPFTAASTSADDEGQAA